MESTEQTEITSKIETRMDGEQGGSSPPVGQRVWSRGIEQKKTGLMDMDYSVVIAEGGGIRGLNGNGKKYNKK